jgi:ribokinase
VTAPTVVVVGDLVSDIVAHLREPLTIGSDATATVRTAGGGSAANVAAWLGWSGTDVIFAGRIGDDAAGDARVRELAALGVDVRVAIDPIAPTGTVIVIVTPDGERTMLPDRGANAALCAADLDDALFAAGRHLHVTGYTLFAASCRAAVLDAIERARAAGMTISIDPSSAAPLRAVGPERFLQWTAGVDLCLPNLDEAMALTGTRDAAQAARMLASHYRQVVVTLGAAGALWTDGEQQRHCAATTRSPHDTTGAGDAFTAGYLAAVMAGDEPSEALRRGVALAGVAVARDGGRPPIPPAAD